MRRHDINREDREVPGDLTGHPGRSGGCPIRAPHPPGEYDEHSGKNLINYQINVIGCVAMSNHAP